MGKTKAHTRYQTKDGIRCKGVTTIINNLGWNKQVLMAWQRRMALAGEDPDAVLKDAGHIGTLAHHMCESDIKGVKANTEDYSAEQIAKAENAFLGYLGWKEMTKPEYVAVELKMVSEKYRVGGTTDFIARINGSLVLGDWKTSKGIYPEMTVQLAAYRKMYLELQPKAKIESAMILKLDKNSGSFSHHFVGKSQLDWGWKVFKCCLELDKLHKEI